MSNSSLKRALCLLGFVVLSSGCGKDYSGQYIGVSHEIRTIYKDGSGKIYEEQPLAFALHGGLSTYHQYAFIRNILSLKHEKDGFSGNLVITDDKKLVEFIVKTGYLDEDKRLHLKLTWKPDVNVGISFLGISAGGSLGEMLLNLDEVPSKEKGTLVLKVSGSTELLAGLFSEPLQGEQTLGLKKGGESEAGTLLVAHKADLVRDSIAKLETKINAGDYYGAMVLKDLLASVGESIPETLVSRIEATKAAYQKEAPERLKKDMRFRSKGFAAGSGFGGEYLVLNYDVENASDFKIRMLGYSVRCRDSRNNKSVEKRNGYVAELEPGGVKSESVRLQTAVPAENLSCEFAPEEITLPRFER